MAELIPESKAAPPETRAVFVYTFQGQQERAIEVHFDIETEGWATYRLDDGSVIKMKNVTSRVLKLLDRKKDDGSPFYVLEGVSVVTTIPPVQQPTSSGEK